MSSSLKYVILGDARSPHLVKWIRELHAYVDLYVLTFQTCSEQIFTFIPKEKCHEFNIPTKSSGNNVLLLKAYSRLKQIFRTIDPDVIHAHYITSYGFLSAICKTKRSKLVLSAWGSDILVAPEEHIFKRMIVLFALKKAQLITSDSLYMSQKINELNKNARVLTFPFGLTTLPDAQFRDKLPIVFFSNRALSKNYRIDRVLELFAEIKKVFTDARLVVANDGDKFQELNLYAEQLGIKSSVHFVGYVNESVQSNYYTTAQFYFSLPESDATSVSLLEAMAYGCVPIVSDIPANREWIEHGKNGIIVGTNTNIVEEIRKIDAEQVFKYNRAIIQQKAIFPESVKNFVKEVNKLFE